MIARMLVGGLVLACFVRPACAELKPDEIGIVAVRASAVSREIADYYARARHIPRSQICLVDATPGETLTRAEWDRVLRPAIRDWILDNKFETRLRCLVTVWDVPLRIERDPALGTQAPRARYLTAERAGRVRRLGEVIEKIDRLRAAAEPSPAEPLSNNLPAPELGRRLQRALGDAQQRMKALGDTPEARQAVEELQRLFLAAGGVNSLLLNVSNLAATSPAARERTEHQIQYLQARVIGLREGGAALQALPESIARDEQMLLLVEKSDGILGSLHWIDAQRQLHQSNESYSSLDSELSLVLWADHGLLRWQPNLLNYRFDGARELLHKTTLMVSRLEAPTVELTRKLIDSALEVEAQGLKGNVYLDARGLSKPQLAAPDQPRLPVLQPDPGSYEDYDQSLRDLAALLKQHTPLNVTLDNKDALFQPGDCPQAAVYCGWYSLARYVDAFDWKPGAVAYHMASAEATTLRNPQSQVWCKRTLEDGVTATLGPAYEPYLAAFPRPDEFFPLLMTGKFTLVETYYRTNPFNSWVMVLIGDPLYNPFRSNPQFAEGPRPEKLRRLLGETVEEQPAPAGGPLVP